jgi:hypothetical protein
LDHQELLVILDTKVDKVALVLEALTEKMEKLVKEVILVYRDLLELMVLKVPGEGEDQSVHLDHPAFQVFKGAEGAREVQDLLVQQDGLVYPEIKENKEKKVLMVYWDQKETEVKMESMVKLVVLERVEDQAPEGSQGIWDHLEIMGKMVLEVLMEYLVQEERLVHRERRDYLV